MKVLIACEESQEVCKDFRAKNFSGYRKSNGRTMEVILDESDNFEHPA